MKEPNPLYSRIAVGLVVLCFSANVRPIFGATVAWWRFEEGTTNSVATGSGTVIDSVHGFNGTPVGNPAYVAADIPRCSTAPNLGMWFNGSTSRVFIPDDPAFELTNSLTLEAFIRYEGQPSGVYWSQIIFRGDDRYGLDPYWLALDPNGVVVFEVDGLALPNSRLTSQEPIPRNVFLHLAGILDGVTGQQRLFINGVEVASTNTTVRPFGPLDPTQLPGLGIGSVQSDNYTEYFAGTIDEVRISDTALQPSEFLFPCSNAAPVLTSHYGAQTLHMYWASQPGRQYQMQWSTNLISNLWVNVGTPIDGGGGAISFPIPTGSNMWGFYRVQVLR